MQVDSLPEDQANPATLGWGLARYRFTRYKTRNQDKAVQLVAPESADLAQTERLVE